MQRIFETVEKLIFYKTNKKNIKFHLSTFKVEKVFTAFLQSAVPQNVFPTRYIEVVSTPVFIKKKCFLPNTQIH